MSSRIPNRDPGDYKLHLLNVLPLYRSFRRIKQELRRRFKATINLLDDPQTTENPAGTLRYLLGE